MKLDVKICLAPVIHSFYSETISFSGHVSYILPGWEDNGKYSGVISVNSERIRWHSTSLWIIFQDKESCMHVLHTYVHSYVHACVHVCIRGYACFSYETCEFFCKKTCSDIAIVISACHRVKTLDLVVSGNRLRAVIGEIMWSWGTQSRDCSSVLFLYTWALRTSQDCCACACLDFVITLQTNHLRIDCIAFLPLCDMCVAAWWELCQDLSVGTKSVNTEGGLLLPSFSKELMVNFL